ncbi:MAG: hypothetical protein HKN91_08155 [Acidimicrobiia bacterium]|nr:hypothetical protein [Acidimicrobiia bacterium]
MARSQMRFVSFSFAAALLLIGCSDAGDSPATIVPATSSPTTSSVAVTTVQTTATTPPTTTIGPTTTTASPSTTTAPTTTAVSGPQAVAITVSVADGEVSGPGRVAVALGAQITLTVNSDEADEVHFHGYDVFADVAPAAPAVILLIADIPGVFEVELEGRGLELLIVEVR